MAAPVHPAVTAGFSVNIDGHDLGTFVTCQGLSLEVQIETREEGGNNAFVHQLPGRITYTNVTFTRSINEKSAAVAQWFASQAEQVKRTQAEICAVTMDGSVIARWGLTGVVPVKWQGPSLTAGDAQLATETLEIAHHGFIDAKWNQP